MEASAFSAFLQQGQIELMLSLLSHIPLQVPFPFSFEMETVSSLQILFLTLVLLSELVSYFCEDRTQLWNVVSLQGRDSHFRSGDELTPDVSLPSCWPNHLKAKLLVCSLFH